MDGDVAALCEALREIDEGRVVSPTWLHVRYPGRGAAVAEALLLESLVASGEETPGRLGPFRVVRELGSGGMGVVYLAEADAPGAAPGPRVAVKVLHARLAARPEAVQALLREAALGRQVRHAHVVPVLDAGTCVVGGRHSVYVAMEFVEGSPLSRRLRERGALPERLCLKVARDVASALDAIHARGIVHRDVKPSNILLSPAGAALLADLGVAMVRSELACVTDRPAFAGTLPYAAPEQIAGAEIDGRADLYALGVTLREMAGDGTGPRRGGRSRFFEELVAKLLAPRRDARFESAAALLEAVEGGERSGWWTRRAAAIRAGGSLAARSRRSGPGLCGRDGEMARLRAAFEATKGGEGGAVLLVGEAGIGKSRLLDEFLRELARRDEAFRLWRCSFPPVRDPSGTLPLERSSRELLAMANLSEELGDLVAPSTSAAVALAETLAADVPLVAVFEDLHHASAAERRVVTAVAAAARGRSLLVVASSREPAAPVLPDEGERIALARLSPGAAQELVRTSIGLRASPDAVSRIAARSGGNPFLALALARTGDRDPEQRARTTLPVAIRRHISGRLSRLPAGDRELLDAAACYGQRVHPAIVARALGIPARTATRRLASIAGEGGLLRRDGRGLVFDHDLVLEALVRGIPARRRRACRARLAAALEATLRGSPQADVAVVLCRLYFEGGRGAEALRHLDRALDALAAGQAHEPAAALCQRALGTRGLVEGARRVDLLLRMAAHAQALGRDDDVGAALEEALRIAAGLGDGALRARVLLQSAERLVATARCEQALAVLAEAAPLTSDPRVDLLAGRALNLLGRPDEACARLEAAVERARAARDVQLETQATGSLAQLHVHCGRLADARRGFEAALSLSREALDREGEAMTLDGLASVHGLTRDPVRSEELGRELLPLVRRAGNRRGEARARCVIGICRLQLGDLAAARREFERSQALAAECGDAATDSLVAAYLGRIAALEGRSAEALVWCERSRSMAERIGQPRGQHFALYGSGVAYSHLGMVEKARADLEESIAIARKHAIRIGEAHVLCALADVYALDSTDDSVLARYEEALAIRREIGLDADASGVMLQITGLLLRRGEPERARPYVEQAAALGGNDFGCAICAAQLPGADVPRLVERVLALEPREPYVAHRMTGRFVLWKATGEIAHLVEAYRFLLHQRDGAPPEGRESILTRVPLHRDIVAAWARDASA